MGGDMRSDHESGGRGHGLDSRPNVPLGVRIRTPGSYGLLLVLIVALLTATAVVGRSAAGRAIVVILQGGVLLFALWTSQAGRSVLRIALVIVPAIVAAAAMLTGVTSDAANAAVSSAGAALAFVAIGAIGRRIASHPRIDGTTILGALCAYLLIGLLFASVFSTANALGDGGFFSEVATPSSVDYLYFSFVTLTTVGFGDRTAAGDLGRMLAVTEALLGQLYLVTVVALVIGNVGREREGRA